MTTFSRHNVGHTLNPLHGPTISQKKYKLTCHTTGNTVTQVTETFFQSLFNSVLEARLLFFELIINAGLLTVTTIYPKILPAGVKLI